MCAAILFFQNLILSFLCHRHTKLAFLPSLSCLTWFATLIWWWPLWWINQCPSLYNLSQPLFQSRPMVTKTRVSLILTSHSSWGTWSVARCEANETVIDNMEQVKDILRNQIVEEVSGRSSTIVDLSYLPILGSFLLG